MYASMILSVRSGARQSMPGMMDTILNLGLNDEAVEGLAKKTGNARFAYDCYRRFVQMFADVVMMVPKIYYICIYFLCGSTSNVVIKTAS